MDTRCNCRPRTDQGFIALDKPDAAADFAGKIFRMVESLDTMPNCGRSGSKGTRELMIGSYIAKYRVSENQVEVLRLRHAAQQWI